MKKNTFLYNGEIELISLLKIIWDGKIKILLITLISFLVVLQQNSQIPINYSISLTINAGNSSELLQVKNIEKLVGKTSIQISNTDDLNQTILAKFKKELIDYEEFLSIIKNTKKVQESLSKLKIEDQEIKLFKYAKLLEIVEPVKNKVNYIINLKWHDPDEAKIILKDTLNLVSKNFKKSIELKLLQSVEFKKKLLLHKNRERLNFLNEQSAIAKELDIIDNQIDSVNLSQSNVSLNISTVDNAYYLRGYKAIDKEIELIKNRESLDFIDQELNEFKEVEIKFVDYNIYLMNTKSLKNTKLILMISILLGLIVGILFVLISNAFHFQIASTKTRKK
jgi:LPS O-antigen subunit length determinant protein (WzzB/FepE family)